MCTDSRWGDLGQLQDHYHQNDNDQDPDDGPNDSSVHFVSFDPRVDPPLHIRSLNTSLWLASTSEHGAGSVQPNLAKIGDQRGSWAEVLRILRPNVRMPQRTWPHYAEPVLTLLNRRRTAAAQCVSSPWSLRLQLGVKVAPVGQFGSSRMTQCRP